jgi:predicted AlkP superfamily phosphohydrolase/phosphomutase
LVAKDFIFLDSESNHMSKVEASDVRDFPRRRVLVLGLDGATFDILEPLVKMGRLPNIGKFMNEGVWGYLDTTLPPVTIPAWPSMMTGKNPGKLGLFDLLKRKDYGVEPNGYCYAEHTPLWQILNRYGIKTGIMNLPGTYPPEEVDGFMVSGMLTPSKESTFCYPSKLQTELVTLGIDYEIDVPQWQYFDEGIFIKDVYDVTEQRGKVAEYLMQHVSCDFYLIVFTCADRIQHRLWDKRRVLESYWETLDLTLSRLLKKVNDDTTIFIVSDHGFGPLERTFFVNEWLNKMGFLKVKTKLNNRTLVKLSNVIEQIYRFLGERALLKPIGKFLNKFLGLENILKLTYSYLSNARFEGRVIWKKTQAFSCVHTPHFGQIYLNMRGKMEKGCVKEEERDDILKTLIEELSHIEDTNTKRMLNVEIHCAKDIYKGPYIENAPELVFLLDNGRCEIDAKVGEGKIFVEGAPLTGWKGTHTKDGVFIAHGPNIKRGYRIEKASVLDFAPTLLYLFGIPLPDDMDGRVLEEIFDIDLSVIQRKENETKNKADNLSQTLEKDEIAQIEERLRKLGYIS